MLWCPSGVNPRPFSVSPAFPIIYKNILFGTCWWSLISSSKNSFQFVTFSLFCHFNHNDSDFFFTILPFNIFYFILLFYYFCNKYYSRIILLSLYSIIYFNFELYSFKLLFCLSSYSTLNLPLCIKVLYKYGRCHGGGVIWFIVNIRIFFWILFKNNI